jgi:hypothetical protein
VQQGFEHLAFVEPDQARRMGAQLLQELFLALGAHGGRDSFGSEEIEPRHRMNRRLRMRGRRS